MRHGTDRNRRRGTGGAFLARCGLLAACLAGLAFLASAGTARAAACNQPEARTRELNTWFDPKPNPAITVSLPLPPAGIDGLAPAIVFTPVGLVDEGLFPRKGAVFLAGSEAPHPFESRLPTRMASSIFDDQGRGKLLMGRYEVSKAQYALVMGGGDLARGLGQLLALSGEQAPPAIRDYLDPQAACAGKLTVAVHSWLRTPITFLTADGNRDFIERLNAVCHGYAPCRAGLEKLTPGARLPAFFRLPSEHEWEFAARGGFSLGRGELTVDDLQADLPKLEAGRRLADYAHLDGDPQRLLPIGSKEALHGFFDILGNAQELAAGPFSSENGYGAVGGLVARGGHFRSGAGELRISRRVELTPYRRDEGTGAYFAQGFPATGIRLVLGAPLSASIDFDRQQRAYADTYVALADSGDAAGAGVADAKNLGALPDGEIEISDELGGGDAADVYALTVEEYGPLRMTIRSTAASLASLGIGDGAIRSTLEIGAGGEATLTTEPLLPDTSYTLRLVPRGPADEEFTYTMRLAHTASPDTGIDGPTESALAYAVIVGAAAIEHRGYVGPTDKADYFPVRQSKEFDAIATTIAGNGAELLLVIRGADGKAIGQSKIPADTGSGTTVTDALGRGEPAFIEIRAATPAAMAEFTLRVMPVEFDDSHFAPSLKEAVELVPGRDYRGTLSPGRRDLYARIELSRVSEILAIANEFSTNADMTLLDPNGEPLPGQSARAGTRDELFKSVLPPGRYHVRLSLAERDGRATPFRFRFAIQARSLSELDPRRQALMAIEDFGEPGRPKEVTLPGSMAAKYYRFVLPDRGYFLISARAAALPPTLEIESENGTHLAVATARGDTASIVRQMEAGVAYRVYVSRPPLTTDAIDFVLQIQRVERDILAAVGGLINGLTGIHDDWYTYGDGSTCTAATLGKDQSSAALAYFVTLYRDYPGSLSEGVASLKGLVTDFAVQIRSGGSWRKHKVFTGSGLSATKVKCPEETGGSCYDEGLVRSLQGASALRFQLRDETIEFSLRGFKAATKSASRACQSKIKVFW